MSDLTDVMNDIGEHLTETTKRRFDTSTAPDGSRWAPNTQTTILNYLGSFSTSYSKKTGKISSKGKAREANKKPLRGRSRMQSGLMGTIYHKAGRDFVEIGSPLEYAAIQQFGGQKSKLPHLWGDIPARPFLGISDQDSRDILDTISDYLNKSILP